MTTKSIAMRDALLERVWQAMGEDKKVFFTCADFGSPVLDKIRSDFAGRFVNVGIAEQNLINVSAGLALEGYTVFAYAIAPFITMRCYEQTRVSLALMSEVRPMNVNLIGVGAGYSYVVSGPTHQCYEDITLMRAMPNFRVLSPADHVTSSALFDVAMRNKGPKYIRLDAQVLQPIYADAAVAVERGFAVHKEGKNVCLIATGFMLHTALKVSEELSKLGVSTGVVDLIDLSGFDQELFVQSLTPYDRLISLEEGFKGRGGMDAMLFDLFAKCNIRTPYLNIGVEGGYRFELGTRAELHEQVGIGPQVVTQKIKSFLA